jgi:hypothetical protein
VIFNTQSFDVATTRVEIGVPVNGPALENQLTIDSTHLFGGNSLGNWQVQTDGTVEAGSAASFVHLGSDGSAALAGDALDLAFHDITLNGDSLFERLMPSCTSGQFVKRGETTWGCVDGITPSLQNNSITSEHILNGTIQDEDLANGGAADNVDCVGTPCIGLNEIVDTCPTGQVIKSNGPSFVCGADVGGLSNITAGPGIGKTGPNDNPILFAQAPLSLTSSSNTAATFFQSGPNPALVAQQSTPGGTAIKATGNVVITGDLTVSGAKNFAIPNPLDPAKTLYHAAIESPLPMNVYTGNVRTDGRGFAVVRLPDYFAAINRDFRYQLTVVGRSFARAIVWREIAGNRFTIRTDEPRVKVSWQVTAKRSDGNVRGYRTERPGDK